MKCDLKTFSSEEEKSIIEKKYNYALGTKYFKIRWMNWGLICGLDEIVTDKIWLIDLDGNIGFYKVYANNKISDIVINKITEENFNKLKSLLNDGFVDMIDCFDCCDGVGYEMILYNNSGEIMHKFCGYIYDNNYLQEIVNLVDSIVD